MHMLCDDARMLSDEVFRVCSCCDLRKGGGGGIIWSLKIDALVVLENLNSVCIRKHCVLSNTITKLLTRVPMTRGC